MNILFLLKTLDAGGLEVVTSVLANCFVGEKHNVCIFAFSTGSGYVRPLFDNRIDVFIGNGFKYNSENISLLHKILYDNQIEIVINQWGLPLIPIKTFEKAKKGLVIKIISFYHNDPIRNGRIQNVDNQINSTSNWIKKVCLKLKRFTFRFVTGYAMRYVYNKSDLYAILSQRYVENFKIFTGIKSPTKLVVQSNPITIDNSGFIYNQNNKQREIVYIGRLDNTQKCVYRIIEAWSKIEKQYSDWRLTIVGDGKDRAYLEKQTKNFGLDRVFFEGIQQPRPYYERASILLLTSDFEGFPLVLAEAMSFGVVPIVYGSFSAVYDIIDNGTNGLISSMPYCANNTIKCLQTLMDNEQLRNQMAIAGIQKVELFSIKTIYGQWYKLFDMIITK